MRIVVNVLALVEVLAYTVRNVHRAIRVRPCGYSFSGEERVRNFCPLVALIDPLV